MASMETVPSSKPEIAPAIGFRAQSLYEKLTTIARNLWWSWHQDVIAIFRDLDPVAWRKLDHNPIALLQESRLRASNCGLPKWCCTAESTTRTAG